MLWGWRLSYEVTVHLFCLVVANDGYRVVRGGDDCIGTVGVRHKILADFYAWGIARGWCFLFQVYLIADVGRVKRSHPFVEVLFVACLYFF